MYPKRSRSSRGASVTFARVLCACITTGGSLAGGCASQRTATPAVRIVDADHFDDLVTMTDSETSRDADSGSLLAQATLRSRTDHEVFFTYRFEFHDHNGRLLNPDSPWRDGRVAAREFALVDGSSPHRDAERWVFCVRPPR